jgi:hypothetical protein
VRTVHRQVFPPAFLEGQRLIVEVARGLAAETRGNRRRWCPRPECRDGACKPLRAPPWCPAAGQVSGQKREKPGCKALAHPMIAVRIRTRHPMTRHRRPMAAQRRVQTSWDWICSKLRSLRGQSKRGFGVPRSPEASQPERRDSCRSVRINSISADAVRFEPSQVRVRTRMAVSRTGGASRRRTTMVVTLLGAGGMLAFEPADWVTAASRVMAMPSWWASMLITTIGSQFWPPTGGGPGPVLSALALRRGRVRIHHRQSGVILRRSRCRALG